MAFVVTNHLADLMPGITYQSRSLVIAPLSHGAGIHAIVNTARGAAHVLPASDKMDPEEVWSLVQQHGVDSMFTVPTIVKMLTEHERGVDRYDHSSLRWQCTKPPCSACPIRNGGELGVAVVVCKPGHSVSAEELLAQLDGRLARYKWPRHVVYWDALPKSAYGKITKKDVRAQLAKEWEAYCASQAAVA